MSPSYDLIIVGGGLSGLTAAYRAQQRGWKFLLLEAQDRWGGCLETLTGQDLLQELGAESMVVAKPWGKDLCRELGLEGQLVSPQRQFQGTLILRQGQLIPIPEGLRLLAPSQWVPFLRSPALSWRGKLRLACDFFLPRSRQLDQDQSLADFVRRRLGQEALDRIAQPLVAGIYTADPEQLSLMATLPQFVELERRYGSICRGLLLSPEARASQGPRYQLFTSLKGGLGQLIQTLLQQLPPDNLVLGQPVTQLAPTPEGDWLVQGHRSRRLILAAPTYALAPLLAPWDARSSALLGRLDYLSSATVNLVYPLEAVGHPTSAYGFVVPAVERRDILACTFSHRKYPGRAPADLALLRAYVGGANRPEAVDWSEAEMLARCHSELASLLQISQPPLHSQIKRYRRAMPLYRVGHLNWLRQLEESLACWPRLRLVGNAYRGVGIPDCIHSANQAVASL